jgi:pimeloyl-ACP methyl ester carboxylesterase
MANNNYDAIVIEPWIRCGRAAMKLTGKGLATNLRPLLTIFLITFALFDARAQTTAAQAATAQSTPSSADVTTTFILKIHQGNLYGTLILPAQKEKVPIVLIIAGSGPTDRNGNALMLGLNTDAYRLLADSLRLHGIASLRYDKRGVAASAATLRSETDIRFDDYISDASTFIKMLQADPRFSRVIVLGHSEGSLIGMIAAARAGAAGYISVAGAGDRIDKIIERQLAAQSPPLAAKATVLLDSLCKGDSVRQPEADQALMGLFRASVQPYMISWLRYDPQQEIMRLHIPVLIIQGTTDLQTSVQDAQALKTAKPDATLVLIDRMNHVFREAGSDRQGNFATYGNPTLPLKPELIQSIVRFIDALPLTIH